MTNTKPAIVFLCVHIAGRSQMAAGSARHLAGDRVEVLSGGSDTAAAVNPAAVAVMAEAGVDVASAVPARWTDQIVRAADGVVTMGCGDECPYFPGVGYEDWELGDPPGSTRPRCVPSATRSAAGLSEEQLARLHAPVGASIGAATPEEIAASIVAELVAERRSQPSSGGPANR